MELVTARALGHVFKYKLLHVIQYCGVNGVSLEFLPAIHAVDGKLAMAVFVARAVGVRARGVHGSALLRTSFNYACMHE